MLLDREHDEGELKVLRNLKGDRTQARDAGSKAASPPVEALFGA